MQIRLDLIVTSVPDIDLSACPCFSSIRRLNSSELWPRLLVTLLIGAVTLCQTTKQLQPEGLYRRNGGIRFAIPPYGLAFTRHRQSA